MEYPRIGNIQLDGFALLAPMAGVSDLAYRVIARKMGAALTTAEMVSAKGLYYHNEKTKDMLKIAEEEHPVSLQLFGSDPAVMALGAKVMEKAGADIVDINMGCPVPKVVNNGEGSALLKNIPLAAKIIEKTVKAIDKPVTVKFRKGFGADEVQAIEMAKAAEAAGAAAVAVHGRTREQYYSGKADWEIIAKVKDTVSIPVIGNGDIFTPEDAKNMMEQTNCDGVMIGRGAQGNPWIFHQIKTYLETGMVPEKPPFSEVCRMILRHAKMQIEWKGEKRGMREMRSHAAWYTAGYPHSASLRRAMNTVETYEQLEELFSI